MNATSPHPTRFSLVKSPRAALRAAMAGLLILVLTGSALIPLTGAQARGAPDSFADLAARLSPAVVNISSEPKVAGKRSGPELPQFPPGSPYEDFFRDFFDRNRPQPQQRRRTSALGSGFIIDKGGIVVTNNHVIEGADKITVILQDNTRLKAEIVGRDKKTDLAVLRVKPNKDLPFVKLGDSDALRVGDWVVAIGNPFGLGGSVTAGIVSARGRDIKSGPYDDFIQTDASINRGNSGGPLFNMNGDVVGINTVIFSPSGGSIGIGFSIPASTAKGIINQLIRFGRTKRGWLGVRIQSVTEEIAESLGLDKAAGALVASVTAKSPAEKGKIKAGDVILKFNGRDVNAMRKLPRIVADTEIGRDVDVVVWRDGKKVHIKIAVGELDEEKPPQLASREDGKKSGKGREQSIPSLGLTLMRVDDGARKRFELTQESKGVVVTKVDPKGAAAEKGIRPGDLIVEVNQDPVKGPAEVRDRVKDARQAGRKSVLLLLKGQSGLRFVAVRIGKS